MSITARLFMDDGLQAVELPDEFRFEGTEVRISKVGDKVIPEPIKKKPFDVAAWRAGLEGYRDIPFMEDGRDQGTITIDPIDKPPIDFDKFWAELDALGARDYLPDGIPDDPPVEPDPRNFFDK